MASGRAQASPTSVRISAGATTSYTDARGNAWLADKFFSGGTSHTNTSAVSGTSAPLLYKSERYGQAASSFVYSIPVSNGNYNVRLHFAET